MMFVVGALLAAAAPSVAGFLGGAGLLDALVVQKVAETSVLWTGTFFGLFGAARAAVEPVFDKLFCTQSADCPTRHADLSASKAVPCHTPEPEQEREHTPCFVKRIEAERTHLMTHARH